MGRHKLFYVTYSLAVVEGRPANYMGRGYPTRTAAEEAAAWMEYRRAQHLRESAAAYDAERARQKREAARRTLAASILERFLRDNPQWPEDAKASHSALPRPSRTALPPAPAQSRT